MMSKWRKGTNKIWAENAMEKRDTHTIICLRTTKGNDSSSKASCGPGSHLEYWDLSLKCPDASGNLSSPWPEFSKQVGYLLPKG